MQSERCLILGSGNSISEGIDRGLLDILKNEISIGINMWYKFGSIPTIQSWVDYHWYIDNYANLENVPLLIGKFDYQLSKRFYQWCRESGKNIDTYINKFGLNHQEIYQVYKRHLPIVRNSFFIPYSSQYHGIDSLEKGIYHPHSAGLYVLTLAIALGFKEIYLLGCDCCEVNNKTHFYEDQIDKTELNFLGNKPKHYGVGFKEINGEKVYNSGFYNNEYNIDQMYSVYKQELDHIKIINVSPKSKINVFPKIDYPEFFKRIKKNRLKINQDKIRKEIQSKVEKYAY